MPVTTAKPKSLLRKGVWYPAEVRPGHFLGKNYRPRQKVYVRRTTLYEILPADAANFVVADKETAAKSVRIANDGNGPVAAPERYQAELTRRFDAAYYSLTL